MLWHVIHLCINPQLSVSSVIQSKLTCDAYLKPQHLLWIWILWLCNFVFELSEQENNEIAVWTIRYSADQFDNNLIEFEAWFCNVNPAPQKRNYSHSQLLVISCSLAALLPARYSLLYESRSHWMLWNISMRFSNHLGVISPGSVSFISTQLLRTDFDVVIIYRNSFSITTSSLHQTLDPSIKVVNLESSYASSNNRFLSDLLVVLRK